MYTNTKHFISRRSFWNTLGLQILSLLVQKIFWARRILRSIAIIITITIITIIIIIIIIRFPRQHLWSSLYFLLQLLSSSTASYTGIFVYNIYLYLYLPHIQVFLFVFIFVFTSPHNTKQHCRPNISSYISWIVNSTNVWEGLRCCRK